MLRRTIALFVDAIVAGKRERLVDMFMKQCSAYFLCKLSYNVTFALCLMLNAIMHVLQHLKNYSTKFAKVQSILNPCGYILHCGANYILTQ
jgi:hypothetical protein